MVTALELELNGPVLPRRSGARPQAIHCGPRDRFGLTVVAELTIAMATCSITPGAGGGRPRESDLKFEDGDRATSGPYPLPLVVDGRCPPRLRFAVMGFWRVMARRAVRAATVAAWGCAVAAIGVAPAVARLRPVAAVAGSCTPKYKGLTAKNARLIVYGQYTGIDPYSGGPATTYYACLRPKGRPVAIGQRVASGGEYPPNVEMQDLRIAGTFATDESADGFASAAACTKYDPGAECNTIVKYWVEIANVAARSTLKVPVSGPVSSLALSPAGAAAWVVTTPPSTPSGCPSLALYAIAVHPGGRGSLRGHVVVIDRGQEITSVSFAGSTLRWSNGAQPKTQSIS